MKNDRKKYFHGFIWYYFGQIFFITAKTSKKSQKFQKFRHFEKFLDFFQKFMKKIDKKKHEKKWNLWPKISDSNSAVTAEFKNGVFVRGRQGERCFPNRGRVPQEISLNRSVALRPGVMGTREEVSMDRTHSAHGIGTEGKPSSLWDVYNPERWRHDHGFSDEKIVVGAV